MADDATDLLRIPASTGDALAGPSDSRRTAARPLSASQSGDPAGNARAEAGALWAADGLRCPVCGRCLHPAPGAPAFGAGTLRCAGCGRSFPVEAGIPRLLPLEPAESLNRHGKVRARTARAFGFEWNRFPEMRAEWERNFLDYMAPRGPEFFRGKRVLDVGCGAGRHAFHAARFGAEVWAVDLGPAVDVAARNTADSPGVHVIQADLCHLPFPAESFDFVYSLGVLHHLPDPDAGLRSLLRCLKPGGEILVYVYWEPEGQPLKRALLALITAARTVTTRLPHAVVYGLAYPVAWAAFLGFVWPYRLLRCFRGLRRLAERIPMKQYARYPFRVCVNDQFDRLAAPIERRATRAEVQAWLERAGLEQVEVRPNFGWGASGRKPAGELEPPMNADKRR